MYHSTGKRAVWDIGSYIAAVTRISIILFAVGTVILLLCNNVYLIPILAAACILAPIWYMRAVSDKYKRRLSDQLESALSIITTSYLRTEDIIASVQENLNYISDPLKSVFRSFITEARLIDANTVSTLHIAWQKTTQHYISDVDSIAACDETIERLLNRGLITKGEGDSTADALYQLLFPLNIIRSQYSLLFSTIMMSRDIGLFRAIWIRLRERKSASGRIILKLIEHQPLTVEHIIVCLGTGKTLVTTESDLQQINSIAAQSLKNYVWLRDIVVKQIIKFINWHVVLLEANLWSNSKPFPFRSNGKFSMPL